MVGRLKDDLFRVTTNLIIFRETGVNELGEVIQTGEGTEQQSSTTELSRNRRGQGKQKDAAHHIPAMTSPGTDASGGGSTPVNMNDE